MKTIILVGSARKDGHSTLVANYFKDHIESEVIHLSDFVISDYNYSSDYSSEDEFITLIERLLIVDRIILLTPVYWYSMSGLMKRFLDRFTDLITIRKDLGYQLKSMSLGAIACGSDNEVTLGFEEPFCQSAAYLGMNYLGFLHTFVVNGILSDHVKASILNYSLRLNGEISL